MTAYLLLILITALLAFCTVRIVRRTGQWVFAVGMAVLYVWTFLGAWFFIGDALSGYHGYDIGLNYYYLMEKMYPFELGRPYVLALLGYALFMAGIVGGVWFVWRRKTTAVPSSFQPIVVDHRAFLGVAVAAALMSFLLVRALIAQAMAADASIYQYTRHAAYAGSTLHALCNEVACMAVLLGWSIRLTAARGRYFTDHGQRWARWAYPAVLLALCVYLMLLGDRHELFMALVLGALVFIGNASPLPRGRFALYLGAVVLPMLVTGRLRDFTWDDLRTLDMDGEHKQTPFTLPLIAHVPRHSTTMLAGYGERFFSNEMFCAHFSLYGILRYDVRPVPFVSARYLAASVVPRALRPDRPASAYDIYAAGTHVQPDQGYTIHHAAAWYINGGWPGILLGGALLGLCWGWLMRLRQRTDQRSLAMRVFALLGVACWTAFLPLLVRDGPEAYKGLVIEGFLLPIGLVLLAAFMARRRTAVIP